MDKKSELLNIITSGTERFFIKSTREYKLSEYKKLIPERVAPGLIKVLKNVSLYLVPRIYIIQIYASILFHL